MIESFTASHRIHPDHYRKVLGGFASGITVLTSGGADPAGMTCQSFFALSLEPPLIGLAVQTNSATYPRIRRSGGFCVNVLAARQRRLADQFSRKDAERWAGVAWTAGPQGNPVLEGCLCWIDCRWETEYPAGDHLLVVGRVLAMSAPDTEHRPLMYFRGQYVALAETAPGQVSC